MDIQGAFINRFEKIRTDAKSISDSIPRLYHDGAVNLPDICASLPPRDCTEVTLAVASSIIALYGAHLRCHGTEVSKHALAQEEERLSSYILKLKPGAF